MLKNLSITSKLRVMVLVPMAMLLALAGLSGWAMSTVRVGGDGYQDIKRNQILIADMLPPPLFLVEAHLSSMEASSAWDPATSTYDAAEYAQAKDYWARTTKEFNERRDFWLSSSQRSKIDPLIREQIEGPVFTTGAAMIRFVEDKLFPAIESNNYDEARAAEETIDGLFDEHRAAVDTMVNLGTGRIADEESTVESTLATTAVVAGVAVAVSLLGLLLLSVTVARGISRPLRRLTETAKNAATTQLPRVVEQLQVAGPDEEVAPPPVFTATSNDEVGELAEALNSMQSTAVRLAGDQATMRRNVQETFVNLGRRNQGLLNRTLSFITDLEQNERDPDTLENLFRLDHLATRMRRNAESLLVLAGTNPTRTWTQPVAMGDVVRSALSEIEAYSRVEYKHVQRVSVRGNVVSDLAHLLAELLENATNFSAPHTRVHVAGRLLQDAYVLQVVDSGVGMPPRELADANRRLETVSELEATPSKVLGMYVVGRLAARHGLQVTLTTAPTDGVAAVIRIPLNLVELSAGSPTLDDVRTTDEMAAHGSAYDGGSAAVDRSADRAGTIGSFDGLGAPIGSRRIGRVGSDRVGSDRVPNAAGDPVSAPPAWVSASAAPPAASAAAAHHLDRYVQVVPPNNALRRGRRPPGRRRRPAGGCGPSGHSAGPRPAQAREGSAAPGCRRSGPARIDGAARRGFSAERTVELPTWSGRGPLR